MYLNIFITDAIFGNKFFKKVNATQYSSMNNHFYKVVMYMKKLDNFCNTHTPDDSQKLVDGLVHR